MPGLPALAHLQPVAVRSRTGQGGTWWQDSAVRHCLLWCWQMPLSAAPYLPECWCRSDRRKGHGIPVYHCAPLARRMAVLLLLMTSPTDLTRVGR